MTTEGLTTSSAADVEAARLLLARLGVSIEDLQATTQVEAAQANVAKVPTFGVYVPLVMTAMGGGTAGRGGEVYRSSFKQIVEAWAELRLDQRTTSDLEALAERARSRARATQRRGLRDGRCAAATMVSALRCIYKHAVNDEIIEPGRNPAGRLAIPRRLPSTRRALPNDRLQEVVEVASTTGDDPELDALLMRLHIETACRRGGALHLRLGDLDPDNCLIQLGEKGGTVRWQPVSPTLMTHLIRHAHDRGVTGPAEQLLRRRNGKPITRARYTTLWGRVRGHLPWADRQLISAHWIRHTTLTWVERNFGHAIARAFAGHTDHYNDGSTHTYVRATTAEVATAVAALTNEPHPLAT